MTGQARRWGTLVLGLALATTSCSDGGGGGPEFDGGADATDGGADVADVADVSDDVPPPDGTDADDVPPPSDADADAAPEVEADTPPPPCESPSDCEEQLDLGPCEEAACTQGSCEVEPVEDCCDGDDECENRLDFQPCMNRVCTDGNTCEYQERPNCCVEDADCEDLAGCCTTASCDESGGPGAEGECVTESVSNCCETDGDCDDGNPDTQDVCQQSCQPNGCSFVAPECDVNKVFTRKDFDDGTLQVLEPSDSKPDDGVGAHVVSGTSVTPAHSLYFGNPSCETYYNGPLEDCEPEDPFAGESTSVDVSVETLQLELDSEGGAFLGFWVRMAAEPAVNVGTEQNPEYVATDFLSVEVDDGQESTTVWQSTNPDALGQSNSTEGWEFQAVDLSQWVDETVRVRFRFRADDSGNANTSGDGDPWFGAYVDAIRLEAACQSEQCSGEGGSCNDDDNACTTDTCTPFANSAGGICGRQSATPGEACASCSQPSDCGSDECFDYACNGGTCSSTLKNDCCEPSSSFPVDTEAPNTAEEGFEGPSLGQWSVEDPFPDDNVSWQVDGALAREGSQSLYFGDPDTQTYEPEPDHPARATAVTPSFQVPDDARTPVLSMWLWMSTEFDGATQKPDPELGIDLLSIEVRPVDGGESERIWESASTVGGSTGGAWQQVGTDLSAWAGEQIRLAFRFDSGETGNESVSNDHGGVRIDRLTVSSVCGADPCASFSDCDDGDKCTDDWCSYGQCEHEQTDPLCCNGDGDCDDGNTCTLDACQEGECSFSYDTSQTAIDNCCTEEPWLEGWEAGFESGSENFEATSGTDPVVWHRTEARAASGSWSYTFSNPETGTFEHPGGEAPSGTLKSPEIDVPPFESGTPYAHFQLFMETEWDDLSPQDFDPAFEIDELRVRVVPQDDDGADGTPSDEPVWTSTWLSNTTRGQWRQARVDLSDYRGQTVKLAFEFASGGAENNEYAGPFIDDVGFATTCKPDASIACIQGGDCTASDACQQQTCTAQFQCLEAPKPTPECCEPSAVPSKTQDFEVDDHGWSFESCTPGAVESGQLDESDVDEESTWQVAGSTQSAGIVPNNGSEQLYFGNGEDYGGNQQASCGVATSPPITLQSDDPWSLRFWTHMDIEPPSTCDEGGAPFGDDFSIHVIDTEMQQEGEPPRVFRKEEDAVCSKFEQYVQYEVDLSAYQGKTIRLQLRFDTWDNFNNTGKGIAVDTMELVRGCSEQ